MLHKINSAHKELTDDMYTKIKKSTGLITDFRLHVLLGVLRRLYDVTDHPRFPKAERVPTHPAVPNAYIHSKTDVKWTLLLTPSEATLSILGTFINTVYVILKVFNANTENMLWKALFLECSM